MSDLITRLQSFKAPLHPAETGDAVIALGEAAAELTALRARNEELRGLLEEGAGLTDPFNLVEIGNWIDRARTALSRDGGE